MDDMDMDDFEIPTLTNKKSNILDTAPSLKMHRGISFGPAAENKTTHPKKFGQTKIEDQNQLNANNAPQSQKPNKGPSIASFLKSNLKSSPINGFVGLSASAAALFGQKCDVPMNKSPSFNPNVNDVEEEEKNMHDLDFEEMDDLDDMDLDDLPEPNLK